VEGNSLHSIKRGKANWIGYILRRNCLIKHFVEGKIGGRIEVTGRRGRSFRQLLELKKTRRHRKLKEEALDHTVWITGFGAGCGLAVRHGMNETALSVGSL
jgi:hypothetical protein